MENRIATKSLRKQLDQVVLHEQVENGIAISSNLNAFRYITDLKHLEEFFE
jgi:hypothetical protein